MIFKSKNAFTLIELTIVLVIMAILANVGFPYAMSLSRDSDLIRVTNTFISDFRVSRQEAINSSRAIYMYPRDKGIVFTGGWEIFNNGNTQDREFSTDITIISGNNDFGFMFFSDGKIVDAVFKTPLIDKAFKICHTKDLSISGRLITVNFLGKTKVEYVSCL